MVNGVDSGLDRALAPHRFTGIRICIKSGEIAARYIDTDAVADLECIAHLHVNDRLTLLPNVRAMADRPAQLHGPCTHPTN